MSLSLSLSHCQAVLVLCLQMSLLSTLSMCPETCNVKLTPLAELKALSGERLVNTWTTKPTELHASGTFNRMPLSPGEIRGLKLALVTEDCCKAMRFSM